MVSELQTLLFHCLRAGVVTTCAPHAGLLHHVFREHNGHADKEAGDANSSGEYRVQDMKHDIGHYLRLHFEGSFSRSSMMAGAGWCIWTCGSVPSSTVENGNESMRAQGSIPIQANSVTQAELSAAATGLLVVLGIGLGMDVGFVLDGPRASCTSFPQWSQWAVRIAKLLATVAKRRQPGG